MLLDSITNVYRQRREEKLLELAVNGSVETKNEWLQLVCMTGVHV